jgi:hypothetical protein
MAIDVYHDFVLVADGVEKDALKSITKFSVQVFDSPVGQGEKKEIVTVPGNLMQKLRQLETDKLDENLDEQIELGEVLAGLLLPPYVRGIYERSLAKLKPTEGLRLRLRLADELAHIPWEYAYIHDTRGEKDSSGFLALDPRISIARHEALAVPGDWFEAPNSRRIVIVMASPEGYDKLTSLPEEQIILRQALSEVQGIKAVFVPESLQTAAGAEQGATLEGLATALMEHTDVFHFSGHGAFISSQGEAKDTVIGEGGILLADKDNKVQYVMAEKLAEMLRSKGVRLVVLGACETGRRDGYNVWSGTAAALLRAGIPAVVAFQYRVKDTLAAAFSRFFYRALVAGLTVDEAMALGRAAMRNEATKQQIETIPDWGAAVLYLRAPGGAVFNPVNDSTAVKDAEEFLGDEFDLRTRRVEADGRVVGAVIGGLQTEPVRVQQKVDEEMAGIMIGAMRYGQRGGKLTVKQDVDTVSGILIGGIVGGGGDQSQALKQLKDFFGPTPAAISGGSGQTLTAPPGESPTNQPATASTDETKCFRCGTINLAGAKFCSSCGAKLLQTPKFCSNCGTPLTPGMQFCASCGIKVAS